jgi:hypothetical protein
MAAGIRKTSPVPAPDKTDGSGFSASIVAIFLGFDTPTADGITPDDPRPSAFQQSGGITDFS